MQPILTTAEKNSLSDVFYDLHSTYARPIVIYKTAKQTVIQTNPDHNAFYAGAPTNSVTEVIQQSGVFNARIRWGPTQPLNQFGGVSPNQPMIRLEEGEARIKLDPTGAAFMVGVKEVTLDNILCNVVTTPRPHGLFKVDFSDFYCKKVN